MREGSVSEDAGIVGCDVKDMDKQFPAFRNILRPSSHSEWF